MGESKAEIYQRVGKEIAAVIAGENSDIACYATAACLLIVLKNSCLQSFSSSDSIGLVKAEIGL